MSFKPWKGRVDEESLWPDRAGIRGDHGGRAGESRRSACHNMVLSARRFAPSQEHPNAPRGCGVDPPPGQARAGRIFRLLRVAGNICFQLCVGTLSRAGRFRTSQTGRAGLRGSSLPGSPAGCCCSRRSGNTPVASHSRRECSGQERHSRAREFGDSCAGICAASVDD